jgi:hypothetical protein
MSSDEIAGFVKPARADVLAALRQSPRKMVSGSDRHDLLFATRAESERQIQV